MHNLTIGQLAKKAHVNIETIRYYERRGLIPEPPRSESGYRHYSQDSVIRIQFIIHAKELGFSLKDVSELLFLRQEMKNALMKLKAECIGRGPVGECPILEALETKKRR